MNDGFDSLHIRTETVWAQLMKDVTDTGIGPAETLGGGGGGGGGSKWREQGKRADGESKGREQGCCPSNHL